jgi:hypothetical protein
MNALKKHINGCDGILLHSKQCISSTYQPDAWTRAQEQGHAFNDAPSSST